MRAGLFYSLLVYIADTLIAWSLAQETWVVTHTAEVGVSIDPARPGLFRQQREIQTSTTLISRLLRK